MGSGEKALKGFHSHRSKNSSKQGIKDVPKGCLAIKVGSKEEEKQRFVIPVFYFNHPLFMQLLNEAEEEYGFEQKGTITIPCRVEVFRYVQDMIHRERSVNYHSNNHHNHHRNHNYHTHNHLVGCFRA